MWQRISVVFLLVWFAMPARVVGITIEFDYSLEGPFPFFNSPEKKHALEAAAQVYERLLIDQLAAIEPFDDNTWRVLIPNPGTGGLSIQGNLTVPADTIRIFVGGRDIPEDDIASAPVRFFVAEFIRETVFEQFREEIPYSIFAVIGTKVA